MKHPNIDTWLARCAQVAQLGTLVIAVLAYYFSLGPLFDEHVQERKYANAQREIALERMTLALSRVHYADYEDYKVWSGYAAESDDVAKVRSDFERARPNPSENLVRALNEVSKKRAHMPQEVWAELTILSERASKEVECDNHKLEALRDKLLTEVGSQVGRANAEKRMARADILSHLDAEARSCRSEAHRELIAAVRNFGRGWMPPSLE